MGLCDVHKAILHEPLKFPGIDLQAVQMMA
jgi:hypothetical protein